MIAKIPIPPRTIKIAIIAWPNIFQYIYVSYTTNPVSEKALAVVNIALI
ncbi:hypothetical protein NWE60_04955 [Mycoplasmopsis felis]|nr:hypothetical protein [Mycoplasmopsis felis]WAM00782.1 hypothetical protein NWE60_04955 [Mycoplasmopsis felis]